MTDEQLPPEPGLVPDLDLGFRDEDVPEAVAAPEPPENDKELGDAEEQEVEDDGS